MFSVHAPGRGLGVLGIVLATVIASSAVAVVLNPGDVFAVGGTTAAARPELAGATIHNQFRPFEIRSAAGVLLYKGTLHSWVVRSDSTYKCHFYHRIESTYGALAGKVDHLLTLGSYNGFTVDADYRTDIGAAGDVGLATVSRSGAPGSSVRPVFAGGGIPAGGRSRPCVIVTNANAFRAPSGFTWIVLTTGEQTSVATPGPF
jgi:hypothetical protein